MPINKIAYQVLEENQQNYINILRGGQSASDTGWTIYADSPGVNPVDGLGGTASITWSQNTVSPLSGDSDLRLVKGATNRQGDGVSIPFTISNRHLAKVLQISFDMELISGTYSTGDLRVSIIQDPSGTPVMLEPVGTNLELGITNQRMREIATFQTHVSVTSYRLCIHVSSTSASAYTVDFANFRVWEQQQSLGSVITDPVAYTPTFVGMSPTGLSFTWQRIGKNIRIMGRGTIASNSSTQWSFTTPNGIVPDFGYTSGEGIQVGTITRGAASDGNLLSLLGRNDNLIRFGGYLALNSGSGPLAWNTWNPFGSGEIFNLTVEFPVLGWGSSVAMSSDSGDGRIVAATYNSISGSYSIGSSETIVKFENRLSDSHSAYSGSTGFFTSPVSGWYQINASIVLSTNTLSNIKIKLDNTTDIVFVFGTNNRGTVSTAYYLNAGQTLSVYATANTSTLLNNAHNLLSIYRISAGSQTIGTNETVACSYYATSTTPQTSPTVTLKLPVRIYDTHGAWGTTTGQFTAPMNGKYRVTLIGSSGGGQPVRLYKQNTSYFWIGNVENATGTFTTSCDVDLLAGNVIDIRTSNGPSAATAWTGGTLGDNSVTVISISRIGT